MASGRIRVGVGGWDFDPWRGSFYPPGLARAKQLAFAGERLTATEINATYYKLQTPELFERWAGQVPDGFRFAVKASRFCTNRKVLAEAGEGIARFCGQGISALGDRLGPINWQFMATKQFDPDDFGAFLKLLPAKQDGVKLRHAVEPRHESFRCAEFVEMCRKAGVAIVFADSDEFPRIADLSGGFSYARLQRCVEDEATGYPAEGLDRWAKAAKAWARGESPKEFDYCAEKPAPAEREVFVFFISGAKVRAPHAAMGLIGRL
ncbi:MAG TPA: DUF72 domain-containing protein [Allosphingosinicella sp.]